MNTWHVLCLMLITTITLAVSTLAEDAPLRPFKTMNPTIEWNPGIIGGIPQVKTVTSVLDHGAKADGVTDDAPAFQRAIDSAIGGAVLIPRGTYVLRQSLHLNKPVVLRGQGPDKTQLVFELAAGDAIRMFRDDPGQPYSIKSSYALGASEIALDQEGIFQPGDYFHIRQQNDPKLTNPLNDPRWEVSWARDKIGQVGRIRSVRGKVIVLEEPLYVPLNEAMKPQIRKVPMVENAGVEDLTLTLKPTDNQADPTVATQVRSSIRMRYAANCWVRNVKSSYTVEAHVNVYYGYRNVIRDSCFHHSHAYGGGGRGYGVNLGWQTTACLVENNVFEHLRHAMLVQVGAAGNVFGYNYSRDAVGFNDGRALCDVSLHGHYPSQNLFEGNLVQWIDVSDYHGPVGPGNTFLRNHVQDYGIRVRDHSHGQNFLGNVLLKSDSQILRIYPDTKNTFAHGNLITGEVQWSQKESRREIPRSLYLDDKPAFWGDMPWPATGSDIADKQHLIPAQLRFQHRLSINVP